ncbi:MAG: ATP-dependent sacrificial sulfur transferase LarE [Clostridiales bacterium]|nr:ATP-dependent sacrificial sulfur transferase LarE [Clostridiales bacterium]
MDALHAKKRKLEQYLQDLGSIAVAFSSGVDSTFLLKVAKDVLGDKAIAVTAKSGSFPNRELKEAEAFCKKVGIRQIVFESDELSIDGFRQNPKNRCYICKKALFRKIIEVASAEGIGNVAEGSNLDDNGDYRPGLVAVAELGIKSPLRYAGLSKEEIRILSKEMDLPTWDKPSFACLASRFVYGETISEEKLKMVEEAEQLLLDLGFRQVRVRVHGNIARIEVLPEEIGKLTDEKVRNNVYNTLKSLGFDYVTMDLAGYRTGSMNETLSEAEKKVNT